MNKNVFPIEHKPVSVLGALPPVIGVWDWDFKGNIIYADEQAAKLFGVDPAEARKGLPAETYFARIHDDDRQMVIDHSLRSISTNGSCHDNFRLVSPTGTRWIISQGRCFPDRDNNPRCFVGLVSEVDAQLDLADIPGFSGGGANDDILYLCLHAKLIASHMNRPFLAYLLEMAVSEVTEARALSRC